MRVQIVSVITVLIGSVVRNEGQNGARAGPSTYVMRLQPAALPTAESTITTGKITTHCAVAP